MVQIKQPNQLMTDEKEYLSAMQGIYPEWIKEREIELRAEYIAAIQSASVR